MTWFMRLLNRNPATVSADDNDDTREQQPVSEDAVDSADTLVFTEEEREAIRAKARRTWYANAK